MTRGLNPPDTLSADDVHTLRAVRRDIYYNGIIGGGKTQEIQLKAVLLTWNLTLDVTFNSQE